MNFLRAVYVAPADMNTKTVVYLFFKIIRLSRYTKRTEKYKTVKYKLTGIV